MNKRKKTFSEQLKLAFILVILIPVLFLGGFIFYSSHSYVKSQRMDESENIIRQNQAVLENWVNQCNDSLKYLAASYTLQEFLQTDEKHYVEVNRMAKNAGPLFYNTLLSNQYFKKITLYTEKDFQVMTDIIEKMDTITAKPWYQPVQQAAGAYWWMEDGEIYIAQKVVTPYPSRIVGIVAAQLEKESMERSFSIFYNMPVKIMVSDTAGEIYEYCNRETFSAAGFELAEMLPNTGWTVRYQIEKSYYKQNLWFNMGVPMMVIAIVLFVAWLCIWVGAKFLVKDLAVLVDEVKEVQKGNLDVKIQASGTEDINLLAENIQGMLNRIRQLIRQVYAKEIERQDLELNLLQSKISPHFLYNNLSAINWLAIDCGEERISEITTELATFYRTALNRGNNIDALSVEIANIKAYVRLQLIAYEDQFDAEYDVDDVLLTEIVPIFILQPLVENAIEHGINQKKKGRGSLRISAVREDEWLYLKVWDNGTTLYEKIGEAKMPDTDYGYGTGNVHRRIQLLYGEECGLSILADREGTTSVIKLKENFLKKQL